jgi:hypothetical protein
MQFADYLGLNQYELKRILNIFDFSKEYQQLSIDEILHFFKESQLSPVKISRLIKHVKENFFN